MSAARHHIASRTGPKGTGYIWSKTLTFRGNPRQNKGLPVSTPAPLIPPAVAAPPARIFPWRTTHVVTFPESALLPRIDVGPLGRRRACRLAAGQADRLRSRRQASPHRALRQMPWARQGRRGPKPCRSDGG